MTNKRKSSYKTMPSKVLNKYSNRKYYLLQKTAVWLLGMNSTRSYQSLIQLINRIWTLKSKSGISMTVSYLKECYRLTTKTLSGEMGVKSATDPRVASRRGLPLIIPGHLRLLLEKRDSKIIKSVLTVLSIYRIMSAKPKLKLQTIYSPFSGVTTSCPEMILVIHKAMRKFNWTPFTAAVKGPFVTGRSLKFLTTSGPNLSFAWQSFPIDAYALRNEGLLATYGRLANLLKCQDLFHKLKEELAKWDEVLKDSTLKSKISMLNLEEARTGKLSLKTEPAGKVRVFAIPDIWTQSLLGYLHKDLFKFLRAIPQDGTFNQIKPIKALQAKNIDNFWCFDLSAATDRLPIDLQSMILDHMYGVGVGQEWRDLLVNRQYWLHSKDPEFSKNNGPYMYAVGQPMGALSSWAMLAVTHHMIVQLAAVQTCVITYSSNQLSWFEDYAILGDDIVIANPHVARRYLDLMESFGVEINLSKSVVSGTQSLEFAKRVIIEGKDLTPIGPKSLAQLLFNPRGLKDMLLNNNLLDSLELATIHDHFLSLLKEGSKFSSLKWIRRMFPIYWDLIGVFGLNLSMDLSPSFRGSAIDSLKDKLQMSDLLKQISQEKITSGWLRALEKDTNIYNKYRRYLSIERKEEQLIGSSYHWIFPSSNYLLDTLSEKLMHSASHFELPISELEQLSLAYSTQTRLNWVFEPEDKIKRASIKSLKLEKDLMRKIWLTDPSTAIAIVQRSQAEPWFDIQDGSIELRTKD